MIRLLLLFMLAVSVEAQIASPTFNPFNNGMMGSSLYGQRPNNYGFQNGFQLSNNNGFQNGFQQSNNNNTTRPNPPLFTRSFRLNNGYLYRRPTLYYDSKSGKMVPWVRKNLR